MSKHTWKAVSVIEIYFSVCLLVCVFITLPLRLPPKKTTPLYLYPMKSMLRIFLVLLCGMLGANGVAQTNGGVTALITDAEQLSSPFTESNEGQYLSALLDGDTQTYWHSRYSKTDNSALHWLEVALREPIKGYVALYVHRRVQAANDHPTAFQISASKDGAEWTIVDTVDVPYSGKNGVRSAAFVLKEEYAHVRLAPVDCYPTFRKFWHAAEIQLYYLMDGDNLAPNAGGLRFNELQVGNVDQYVDPSFNYGGWVELHNGGDAVVSLYELALRHTDAEGETEVSMLSYEHGLVSPSEYATLWFDHHASEGKFGATAVQNIPFKLDSEGGKLELLDAEGEVIDAVNYPPAVARCSYARRVDGEGEWGMTGEPSPGVTNAGSLFATERLAAPVVSVDSKVITGTKHFSVDIPEGAILRYTTDGSTPTHQHGMISTTGRFSVAETMVYRFVLVADGYLPSQVVTRSFIKDDGGRYTLPILSLATHPDNMFSPEIGLYTRGTNGVSGNGQPQPCNWNMDWERPVNVEYLVPEDGGYKGVINQECEFKISGGFSRAYGGDSEWEMKSSFSLKAGKVYEGLNSFNYPFFAGSKNFNKYKVFKVRNGGNDTYVRLTDAAFHEIFRRSGFNINVQCWQPAHIFINGKYLGMLNLRESNNKYFAESEYGIDTDDVDQFEINWEKGYEQKEGSKDSFMDWLHRTKALAADPTNEALWNAVAEVVDVDEFCNYMAAEIYMGGSDWLTNCNNIKGFKSRNEGGKYHMVLFDLDSTFGNTNMLQQVYNLLSKTDGRYADNNGVSYLAEIFFNMMQYEPFRKQFIDTYCIVAGSIFEATRCKAIIDEMAAYTSSALALEGTSPNSSATQLYNKIASESGRKARLQTLQNFYNLSDVYKVKLSSNIPEARLMIGGVEVPTGKFEGTLFAPITLTAKAPVGYEFKGWTLKSNATSRVETVVPYSFNWKYYDKGTLDNTGWQKEGYSTSAWSVSQAPFGYGTVGTTANAADYNTTLDYGTDSSNKRPTYYFRTTFNLDTPPVATDAYSIDFMVDDGVIFYVNGVEVGAYNVVSGATYSTYAQTFAENVALTGRVNVPASLLRQGVNVIAAEVHNSSGTSSDIFFDAQLVRTLTEGGDCDNLLCASETFMLSEQLAVGTYELEAYYQPINGLKAQLEAGATPVRINEVGATNEIFIDDYFKKRDWVELYNATDEDIDLEGMYLSDNRSNPQKYRISAEGSDASTIIPAKGYRIVWCDKQAPLHQLHANFKLDNADGAYLSLQAEDGSWADEITYLAQDLWQTYGRYPDGGVYATLFDRASIGLPNQLGTYRFDAEDENEWVNQLLAITLQLKQGWNWVSHNMQEAVNNTRFTTYARSLQSQTSSMVLDDASRWVGKMKELLPAEGYKVEMKQAADVTLRGILFDATTSVELQEGWNWKGFPLYNATALDVALENFHPTEGDAVVGKEGFSIYADGAWRGTLRTLTPGRAYMMYATRPQSFTWNSLASSVQVRKSKTYAPPSSEQSELLLEVNQQAYPNVACVIAEVLLDGERLSSSNYSVAAFCGDECRGTSELIDGLFYLNLHGANGEMLRFTLINELGEQINLSEQLQFTELQINGTHHAPFKLTASPTSVQLPTAQHAPVQITYYNLNGQQILRPTSGCYLQRTLYSNGYVQTKKVMK